MISKYGFDDQDPWQHVQYPNWKEELDIFPDYSPAQGIFQVMTSAYPLPSTVPGFRGL